MKRKYKVEWYAYELTEPCCRKFFTELAAVVYGHLISRCQHAKVRISEV